MSRTHSQPKNKSKNIAYDQQAGKSSTSKKDHHLIDIIPQLFWIHNDVCKYINLPLRHYVGGMDGRVKLEVRHKPPN